MAESAAPPPRRVWLPWLLLVIWLGWIVFLAWTSRPYWGQPRPIPAPEVKREVPGP